MLGNGLKYENGLTSLTQEISSALLPPHLFQSSLLLFRNGRELQKMRAVQRVLSISFVSRGIWKVDKTNRGVASIEPAKQMEEGNKRNRRRNRRRNTSTQHNGRNEKTETEDRRKRRRTRRMVGDAWTDGQDETRSGRDESRRDQRTNQDKNKCQIEWMCTGIQPLTTI